MTKIKVSDASGPVLDWLVGYCDKGWTMADYTAPFSTEWEMAGPIIEREKIDVFTSYEGSFIEGADAESTGWAARRHTKGGPINPRRFLGTTPLIAAMRCYVASKLGEEVEVPEELV